MSFERKHEISDSEEDKRPINDRIRGIRYLKQLTNIKWDIDSPRFRMACMNLGIEPEDVILKYFNKLQ